MSTHNICFHGEIKENMSAFRLAVLQVMLQVLFLYYFSMAVAPDMVRIAVCPIGIETTPSDCSSLTGPMTVDSVTLAANALTRGANTRNTASAITAARTILETEGRKDIAKIIFAMYYNMSLSLSETKLSAAEARQDGIMIMVLGLGSNSHLVELNAIASKPELVFVETDVTSLPALELWDEICQGENFAIPFFLCSTHFLVGLITDELCRLRS